MQFIVFVRDDLAPEPVAFLKHSVPAANCDDEASRCPDGNRTSPISPAEEIGFQIESLRPCPKNAYMFRTFVLEYRV